MNNCLGRAWLHLFPALTLAARLVGSGLEGGGGAWRLEPALGGRVVAPAADGEVKVVGPVVQPVLVQVRPQLGARAELATLGTFVRRIKIC